MASDSFGYLFVAGCPRSGTTALALLLNRHPQVVVGIERFKYVRSAMDAFFFHEDVFFAPVPQETNGYFEIYPELRERWRTGQVRFIGDKNPFYTYQLEDLDRRFPNSHFVVIVRDALRVASSFQQRAQYARDHWPARNDYRRAIEEWNEALRRTRAFMESSGHARVWIVDYEALFSGDTTVLLRLLGFLGLAPHPEVDSGFETMTRDWVARAERPLVLDEEMIAYVQERQDEALLDWYRGRLRDQQRLVGEPAGTAGPITSA